MSGTCNGVKESNLYLENETKFNDGKFNSNRKKEKKKDSRTLL